MFKQSPIKDIKSSVSNPNDIVKTNVELDPSKSNINLNNSDLKSEVSRSIMKDNQELINNKQLVDDILKILKN